MKSKKKNTQEGGVRTARAALVWFSAIDGGMVELPKALPVIRF